MADRPDTAEMPLSDVRDLDAVVHALGIEDSDETPAEAVAKLYAEIQRLHADNAMLIQRATDECNPSGTLD